VLRPGLRARVTRRTAAAFAIVAALGAGAAVLAANVLATHIDSDPVELMALRAAPAAPRALNTEIAAVPTPLAVTKSSLSSAVLPPASPAVIPPLRHDAPAVAPVRQAEKPVSVTRAMLHREPVPMFDGRPIRPKRAMKMEVTGYSPDARSCGASADGITASGYSVWTNGMYMVAADTRLLPFGSLVSIPGYNGGRPVPVLDRGGAIKGHRLDLLYPTHEAARAWGRKTITVTVWEYAD
jgi:3D (Asp-Asp-Asp) domain-containing protein